MPVDPLTEEAFPLSEAAKRLPRLRKGRPVHASTVWRWALSGIRGVRLETVMIGGVRVTSAQAMRRFFAALSDRGAVAQPAKVSQDDAVEQALDRFKI